MRFLKVAAVLLICGIVLLSSSCIGQSNSATPAKNQIAAVQKGSISLAVTGTGNLVLTNKQDLAFGQTGKVSEAVAVKISELPVAEGQVVEKAQVIAKLDPKDWQDQITSLQHQLDSKKTSLIQAQANLVNAQYNLSVQQDIKAAQDKIDKATYQLQTAEMMFQQAVQSSSSGGDSNYWRLVMAEYKDAIVKYQKEMQDLLNDPASKGVSVTDIKSKQLAVEMAQANVITAQNAVDDAQRALDDEKNSNQIITSPFKGLITKVYVDQGDIVQRSANIVQVAEPDKFQADILVTERDVFSIMMGGDATVSLDALSGLNFPAKITKIAPLATVQQGVVNYKVTVELASLTPVFSSQSGTGQRPLQSSSGAIPTSTGTPRPTASPPSTPRAVILKDGLTATVNIIIQQKDNILLVPSRAITRQGRDSTVQVMKGTTTETRIIKTGISDYLNTEITDGLSEGEQVSIPAVSSTSSTPRPGGIPGMGGPIRIP